MIDTWAKKIKFPANYKVPFWDNLFLCLGSLLKLTPRLRLPVYGVGRLNCWTLTDPELSRTLLKARFLTVKAD